MLFRSELGRGDRALGQLAGSIAAELRFARNELLALGLSDEPPPGPPRSAQPVSQPQPVPQPSAAEAQ